MIKIKKRHSNAQKEHVFRAINWCKRHNLSFNELFFDEELSGSEGVSITLFVFKDTPESQIQVATKEIKAARDVTQILVQEIPKAWRE